jgi:hypothetical protein
MESIHEPEYSRIVPGMDVCDVDGHRIATVAHLHQHGPGAAGYVEAKTGFFIFGKRLFIPLSAVRDVAEGGVFLSQRHDAVEQMGWHNKPPDLDAAPGDVSTPIAEPSYAARQEAVAAPVPAAVSPTETIPGGTERASGAATGAADWEAVAPHYRDRWEQHYGADRSLWEQNEPRYRFAWEMGQRPDFAGRSWYGAQADLRDEWERRSVDITWDQASDAIRDAWDHPVGAAAGGTVA